MKQHPENNSISPFYPPVMLPPPILYVDSSLVIRLKFLPNRGGFVSFLFPVYLLINTRTSQTRYNASTMDEDPLSKAFNSFLGLFRKKKDTPATSRGGIQPPSAVSAPRGADARPVTPEPPKLPLKVTSHVSRDLLQNAAYFSTLPKAIAEYVTNAIDSASTGQAIRCEVTLSPTEVTIADNGSGMSHAELSNFFQMHGENIQRRRGRTVRGKFGTGKSAAFGVANILQVETVQAGKRNIVELHRRDVESARDGHPIPVRELVVDEAVANPADQADRGLSGGGQSGTSKETRGLSSVERSETRIETPSHPPPIPNGTTIRIRDLQVETADPLSVQAYLEKLLGQHLRSHKVRVNGKLCRYRQPRAALTFDFQPPQSVSAVLGRVKCRLSVSSQELERDDNTVAVLCHGFLHAVTLAGRGREPLVEYLFGEVEVPSLDDDPGPVPPFDNTRSLALNPHNPRVQVLEAWLGECIDEVLAKLEEREKRRKADRERRLLKRVAGRIKSLLDEDFQAIQAELPWANLPSSRGVDDPSRDSSVPRSADASLSSPPRPSLVKRSLRWLKNLFKGRQASRETVTRPPRGSPAEFTILYARQGSSEPRARYDAEQGIITLNRDHPQLRTAEREAGLHSITYRMLCFDIAFTEYALAVAETLSRQAARYKKELDANALVQSILDRLGRRAAEDLAPLDENNHENT